MAGLRPALAHLPRDGDPIAQRDANGDTPFHGQGCLSGKIWRVETCFWEAAPLVAPRGAAARSGAPCSVRRKAPRHPAGNGRHRGPLQPGAQGDQRERQDSTISASWGAPGVGNASHARRGSVPGRFQSRQLAATARRLNVGRLQRPASSGGAQVGEEPRSVDPGYITGKQEQHCGDHC
jgi:hypothetical protein